MTATAMGEGIAGGLLFVAGMGFFALTRWYIEGGWREAATGLRAAEAAAGRAPEAGEAERDPAFGAVTVRVDRERGVVSVDGPAVPLAELRRREGARRDAYSPIGTRDGAHLALRLAGASADIEPGKGHLTRTSYRVDVQRGGARYRLVPVDSYRSGLLRDRRLVGTLCADGDGGVSAHWEPGERVEPAEASLGYLLAAAFGTGGQHVLLSLLLALGGILGGMWTR